MALPTQKHNRSRSNRRRANDRLKPVQLATCPTCKKSILPHTACGFCGNYKGKKIMEVKVPKKKK